VTFEEYDRFAAATGCQLPKDQGWGRGRRPVINISWDDAIAFTNWLSSESGKSYRLPSEAEWEYAARSGGKQEKFAGTSRIDKLDEYAWYGENSGRKTQAVGDKKPNGLGLYDMTGNVWEWVQELLA
jgi:eukaryotic-like serine/threonine-protein kinase